MDIVKIIYSASESDSDLYYVSGFSAPDPFLFVELNGKKIIFLSDLEYERGRSEARVDEVVRTAPLVEQLKKVKEKPGVLDILLLWLEQKNIDRDLLTVKLPFDFPAYLYKDLVPHFRKIEVEQSHLYIEQRMKKSMQEVQHIKEILSITSGAFDIVKKYLGEAKIQEEFLYYNSEKLTSEFIRKKINEYFAQNDAFAFSTIIASGNQGCEPHNIGSGPIYAHKTLIVDIYPKSLKTRYFGDMTRTFLKGNVSDAVGKLYDSVKKAHEMGITMIKAGIDGGTIHSSIIKLFEENGYKTGPLNGKVQGFIHTTGHGLGLDIHEPPRIGPGGQILEENYVVTIEPGLYYFDVGAVRIEDVVLIKKDGAELLSSYPKVLKVS